MKKFFWAFILVIIFASQVLALPSITMLSTKTCPACSQMLKVFSQIDRRKIKTSHIYLEDNPDFIKKYNVRYVPVLIFRDDAGKEIARKEGYMSKEKIIKIFNNSGVIF